MKCYKGLFKTYKDQPLDQVFAYFHAKGKLANGFPDYDEPFRDIAKLTVDGENAWGFRQPRFQEKHVSALPKLRNYLNYTFLRLVTLEQERAAALRDDGASPGVDVSSAHYFLYSKDQNWVCFNTGLQSRHAIDLILIFERSRRKTATNEVPDWVYKGCYPSNDPYYRQIFGKEVPDIAVYSRDSRDFVFDLSYSLDGDSFDHLVERARERTELKNSSDDVVHSCLRGTISGLRDKIIRNYKVAIPVYYIEEQRMQLLLPFILSSGDEDASCFVVQRNDELRTYELKTIFDLDQAYFSARLIARPDKDWLNP